ncbi:histone-lysine N-methyltransferase ASHR3-like isoform X1 [Panicum miliaceum]|uniref:Histone-lysine N-methyltransferase ASHR3-like isoform X1 n=1 Tax=Panicum miliaceum TaxID=4540 RepID=A0A3L6QG29_PANMI|nr:histone-lysine N-methyltransferase ASHR3-like isoform X1 [Panicum miliaceum]
MAGRRRAGRGGPITARGARRGEGGPRLPARGAGTVQRSRGWTERRGAGGVLREVRQAVRCVVRARGRAVLATAPEAASAGAGVAAPGGPRPGEPEAEAGTTIGARDKMATTSRGSRSLSLAGVEAKISGSNVLLRTLSQRILGQGVRMCSILQVENADSTSNIEEVFCRLPIPYVNEDFNADSTIRDFAATVCSPPSYTAIRRNVYLIKKHTAVRVDTGCTNCRADSTCKEDCECRAVLMSCSKNCRCSDLCINKPFRKDKKIKIVKTKQCAWGAVALEPMEKGEFVIEYVGEVIDDVTREQRLWNIDHGDKNCYMCEISKDFTIDATFKGNVSRFLDHGREPNCKLEKWPVRRYGSDLPSFHSFEAIARTRRRPHDASIGARGQHVASIGGEQNNMDFPQRMVDFGRQDLDHGLEQDLLDESLDASVNDADQQAQRSDEHVTQRPLSRSTRVISKKHKFTAEMPCIEETRPVHPEPRSAQANVNKQEANREDYSISRCLDVLDAMDDVPDEIKILASDVFRDVTNREMFLCYAPRLRGL